MFRNMKPTFFSQQKKSRNKKNSPFHLYRKNQQKVKKRIFHFHKFFYLEIEQSNFFYLFSSIYIYFFNSTIDYKDKNII